jgi:hypothetical protein
MECNEGKSPQRPGQSLGSEESKTRNAFKIEGKCSFFAKYNTFVGNMALFCNFRVNTQLGCPKVLWGHNKI